MWLKRIEILLLIDSNSALLMCSSLSFSLVLYSYNEADLVNYSWTEDIFIHIISLGTAAMLVSIVEEY